MVGAEATRFRAVAARANYLSGDGPDIQYALKEICRRMAKPFKTDWEKLIRLGRYLKQKCSGEPRPVWAAQSLCNRFVTGPKGLLATGLKQKKAKSQGDAKVDVSVQMESKQNLF